VVKKKLKAKADAVEKLRKQMRLSPVAEADNTTDAAE
jgi:hypothetical protein